MSNRGTVGIKDKGRVLELPSGNDAAGGETGLAPPGRARLRLNLVTSRAEISIDENAYEAIVTGDDESPWVQSGTVVSLDDPASVDDVQIDAATTIDASEAAPQLRVQPDDAEVWIQLAPQDVATPHPPVDIRVTDVLLNGVEDQVFTLGHNANNSLPGAVRWFMQMEYNFKTGAGAAPVASEWFMQWISANGVTVLRPISCNVDWDTELITWGLRGDGSWESEAGTQLWRYDRTGLVDMTASTSLLRRVGNDLAIISAQKAGGAFAEVIRIHSTDWIMFDVGQNYGGVRISSPGGLYTGLGSPAASAVIASDSTTKGWLPPRMTTVERDAIGSPAVGLMVYNTTTNKLNLFTGTWEEVTSA